MVALRQGFPGKRAFGTLGSEPHQLRHGLDVPVGVIGSYVAQIAAELDHLPIGVEPLAVPVDDRTNSEGVPKIVNARTAPMLIEPLHRTQTDVLRDDGEVVAGRTVAEPAAVIVTEECGCRRSKEPCAFGAIDTKLFDRARRNRHKARTTILAALYRDDPRHQNRCRRHQAAGPR